ncbi:hypothetical protein Tsp_02933 [Trichinella spiralis]|uniref:hypothetical protein n=1 Tax=Trichinella spiralis TaxID=6334 RepID=UPI0001EFCDA7|nr:hypothetical protein Tsp_02933 [Trichinella spiralis]
MCQTVMRTVIFCTVEPYFSLNFAWKKSHRNRRSAQNKNSIGWKNKQQTRHICTCCCTTTIYGLYYYCYCVNAAGPVVVIRRRLLAAVSKQRSYKREEQWASVHFHLSVFGQKRHSRCCYSSVAILQCCCQRVHRLKSIPFSLYASKFCTLLF